MKQRIRQSAELAILVVVVLGHAVHAAFAATDVKDQPTDFKDQSAAAVLPATTVVYAEIARPRELWETLLNHPLRSKVEGLDAYRKALLSPQVLAAAAGVALVEKQIDATWREALSQSTGGGISVAFDAQTQGVVALVRATNVELRNKLFDTLLNLARGEAQRKGGKNTVKTDTYRGLTVYRADKLSLAMSGPWLVATNHEALGKTVIDNLVGKSGPCLENEQEYQSARKSIVGQPAVWAYAKVAALRNADMTRKLLLQEKHDNPALEILGGGVLNTVGKTPYATASIYIERDQLRLALAAPHDPAWAPKPREFFFGPRGAGSAPPLLAPKNALLSLAAYRDLAGMWQAAADLFDENANAGLAQADSNLTTLFGGRDFSRDILGAVGPEVQFVAARQDYQATGMPEPHIKIPAFGVGLRLKDPKLQRQLIVSYQSIVGFFNIVGGQQQYPSLEMATENLPGGKLLSATYVIDDERRNAGQGNLLYNFSPSMAIVGDRLFVTSTKQLAAELASGAKPRTQVPAAASAPAVDNTRVELTGNVLHAVLHDNREQLISQNMLKKGQTRRQAELEIDGLVAIAQWFDGATARLATDTNSLRLEVAVRLAR